MQKHELMEGINTLQKPKQHAAHIDTGYKIHRQIPPVFFREQIWRKTRVKTSLIFPRMTCLDVIQQQYENANPWNAVGILHCEFSKQRWIEPIWHIG